MTHDQLADKILKAMGGKVPIGARQSWGNFVRERRDRFFLADDWVKDQRIWQWADSNPEVDIGFCSDDGMELIIIDFGRQEK